MVIHVSTVLCSRCVKAQFSPMYGWWIARGITLEGKRGKNSPKNVVFFLHCGLFTHPDLGSFQKGAEGSAPMATIPFFKWRNYVSLSVYFSLGKKNNIAGLDFRQETGGSEGFCCLITYSLMSCVWLLIHFIETRFRLSCTPIHCAECCVLRPFSRQAEPSAVVCVFRLRGWHLADINLIALGTLYPSPFLFYEMYLIAQTKGICNGCNTVDYSKYINIPKMP